MLIPTRSDSPIIAGNVIVHGGNYIAGTPFAPGWKNGGVRSKATKTIRWD